MGRSMAWRRVDLSILTPSCRASRWLYAVSRYLKEDLGGTLTCSGTLRLRDRVCLKIL